MKKLILVSSIIVATFIIFTLLVKFVDVQAIGPIDPKTGLASEVGFASFNNWFHNLTGVHFTLYYFTDYGSIVTVPVGTVFFIMGIVQWCKRKNILKVDANILALGCFYILDLVAYLVFEFVVKLNYRPVLIDGKLESSYPSSTTMLAITLLLSAVDQINIYLKSKKLRIALISICVSLIAFFIIGRIVSGVHWATDIIGGALCSSVLFCAYMILKKVFLKYFPKYEKENI